MTGVQTCALPISAKIVTATKKNVLSIPIQALTVRTQRQLEADTNAPSTGASNAELQGAFVVRNKRAEFVVLETGISGQNEIEVKKGLNGDEEIVIGPYKVVRTVRNKAPVVVDNKVKTGSES